MPIEDDDSAVRDATLSLPDAHGRAALLLVESLIHELCENASLSNGEAVEIVERAISVQSEQAEAADGAGAPLWQSHELLLAIAASLRIDSGGVPPQPRLVS